MRKASKDDFRRFVGCHGAVAKEDWATKVMREVDAVIEKVEPHITRRKFVPPTPEERLLRKRERKRKGFRGHTQSFLVVNAFLIALWAVGFVSGGGGYPWFVFPLLGWGMGWTFHALGYRSWLTDNRQALQAAERMLLPEGQQEAELERWDQLVERCRSTVEQTKEALSSHPELEVAQAELGESLDQVTRLAEGGRDIEQAISAIVPDGVDGLDTRLAAAESAWSNTEDPGLKSAHEQNWTLLRKRREKIAALQSERDRIVATLEGFVLAAENLRLDALRQAKGDLDPAALQAPVRRLQQEVEVLEKVRSELAALN
ncbi:MAG: 2TM domain-containing protein [Myxococcota bacterium]